MGRTVSCAFIVASRMVGPILSQHGASIDRTAVGHAAPSLYTAANSEGGIMEAIDTLIDARWVVPVEPANVVLEEHSIAVRDGRIVAILPTAEALQRFSARAHRRLPGHALVPGLVNAHTHAAMTLMRGYADDVPLMTWLNEHIWPAEGRYVSREFVYDGGLLGMA